MSTPPPLSLRTIVLLVAVSAPLALGFETLLRVYLFLPLVGAELREVREFYWPELSDEVREAALTNAAWVLVVVCVLAGLLGIALLRRAARRGLAAARESANPSVRARANVRDRMLLLTSIPQVPAILATLCFSFGAQLLPVLCCMGVSTAFVLAQGHVGERALAGVG